MAALEEVSDLIATATSALKLIQSFTTTLQSESSTELSNIHNAPDPLDVAHDAAKLLKAHTTKLSLLVINDPFTPSAIRKVLTELTNGCLPALMSAVEICQPPVHGKILHDEMTYRVRGVLREYEGMMQELLSKAHSVQGGGAHDTTDCKGQRDSLASTGVVWEACDSLMELRELGMVGVVVKKAEGYRAILQDAVEELKEWGEGEDEGFSEPEFEGDDDPDSIVNMLDSAKLPIGRDDLKKTLQAALKKLKLANTLFQAIIKRRLKTATIVAREQHTIASLPSSEVTDRVNRLMDKLKMIPDAVDELASALYELDDDEAQQITETIHQHCKDAIEIVRSSWDDEDDEFTSWSRQWMTVFEKV